MKMDLKRLFDGVNIDKTSGSLNLEINNISYDSRSCGPGSLFVAIKGAEADGHDYIDQAIENGANVIVVEKNVKITDNATYIKVRNTRFALALISANYFSNPAKKMKLVGVTGTNGKTTTIHLLNEIYKAAGYKTGMIGTIGANVAGNEIPLTNTTPESYELQKILAQMAEKEIDYCFIEVSSHALVLNRVAGLNFHGAIYTNLSPDHMEFHNNMEDYYLAKRKLFRMTDNLNIINSDDYWGSKILKEENNLKGKKYTYAIETEADFKALNHSYFLQNVEYDLLSKKHSGRLKVNLPGQINIYNSLGAAAFALTDGLSFNQVKEGLARVEGVKGRFEQVYRDDEIQVMIDFAHTEDGLKETVLSLKPFFPGRVILVFGVYAPPGLAGRSKRLAMGKTAAEYADYLIVTSDNPKKQNQEEALAEILEGIKSFDDKVNYRTFVDREEAIENAIKISGSGDLVLLTGKGHERAQIIGTEAIPFNEKEIVLKAISKYKNKAGI